MAEEAKFKKFKVVTHVIHTAVHSHKMQGPSALVVLLLLLLTRQAENVRRRHNYIPLIVELLKVLAEGKQLDKLMEAGEEKAKAAYEKAVKRKADEKKRKADAAAAASSATASASASSGGGGAGGGAGKK